MSMKKELENRKKRIMLDEEDPLFKQLGKMKSEDRMALVSLLTDTKTPQTQKAEKKKKTSSGKKQPKHKK